MKRILLALSFVLMVFAAVSCDVNPGDCVASYSKEIRIDDPVTVRLFDSFALKDNDQMLEAARKALSISPKVDFDIQIVDPQTF